MTRKRVHLIGIGGVGMAGLAVLLKARGCEVTGCDLKATPRTRWLQAQGIAVAIGHDGAHVADADEVVVTPAVAPDEPELVAARGRVRVRGEVLAEIAGASETIAVCGSHGKTTTATWIAKLLRALGEDPSWCIGGETGDFPVAGVGTGPLVVEADESDGTLALYRTKTLVVNRCDYDHPDHFKTAADYFACYDRAKARADEVIESEALGSLESDKVGSGSDKVGSGSDKVGLESAALSTLTTLKTLIDGLAPHNRKNARAAVEVALRRGHALADVLAALPAIVSQLPDRRFQVVWSSDSQSSTSGLPPSTSVVTDYAHHPAEMKCAVGMARAKCRGTLRVLFQPHRYSRTKALLGDFPAAFEGADEVVLCPIYAAFERPVEGGDIADLYRACRESFNTEAQRHRGVKLYLSRSCEEAWEHARNSMSDGDLTLLLGAGDIINLVPRIQAELSSDLRPPTSDLPSVIFIGAGSNTWKSDLKLNVEYVKTTGPAGAPGATLGIPWMAGIPGTIGGWIKMNAGAFGHSISEVLEAVKVDGRWIPAADCGFGYRTSGIVGEIQDYRLLDQAAGAPLPRETAEDFLARRRKFPAGTYGSFFKNPPGNFAGRLLEEAGAKELKVGGAYVWSEHANVIVRGEGWTPSDVLALARLMAARVYFRFGVRLEPEVCGVS